jgi:hypothetical protein
MMQAFRAMGLGLVLAALFCSAGLARAGGKLDGKTFDLVVSEKGKEATQKDQIIFKDGKFRSPGCDQYGFVEAEYKTTDAAGALTFDVVTKSEKEGEIHWTGSVKGDSVEGSYVWTKTGQAPIEYTFKGTLQKPA